MDIADTLAAKSDQANADDLIGGPRTVTITGVKVTGGDQPVSIYTTEFGPDKPYKPCLTMRRAIVDAWGADTSMYTGRRMTLYRDAEVTFGNDKPGGIRISHLSHIDKQLTVWLKVKRGKSKPYKFDPLPDEPKPTALTQITDDEALDFGREIAESTTLDELNAVGQAMTTCDLGGHKNKLQAAWRERSAAIKAAGETTVATEFDGAGEA